MVVLSKFASTLRPLGCLKSQLRWSGGARQFFPMDSTVMWKRALDTVHFYVLGIGVFPLMAMCGLVNIVYGKSELRDWPEDGYAPRYWQYDEGILSQLFVRYFQGSARWAFERRLAAAREAGLKQKWRELYARADHLIRERGDMKAWYYMPYKEDWMDHAEFHRTKFWENFDNFTHDRDT